MTQIIIIIEKFWCMVWDLQVLLLASLDLEMLLVLSFFHTYHVWIRGIQGDPKALLALLLFDLLNLDYWNLMRHTQLIINFGDLVWELL